VDRGLMAGNLDYGIRKGLNSEAKQAIAKSVAAVIPNGSVIAFSIGTTPELVAAALLDHDELRVFTNNLGIAVTACRNPSFDVNIVGGRARNKNLDVFGPDMAEFISSYRLDFGVYGVAGVDSDGAC
jgi:DeoR family glycerol-3-phosphate regulon repressor